MTDEAKNPFGINRSIVVAALIAMFAATACRSKIDSDVKYAPKPTPIIGEEPVIEPIPDPIVEPTIVEDGVNSPRVQFQTRNVMRLVFSDEALSFGQTIKLINQTSGAVLVKNQPISSAANLQLLSPSALQIELYPMDAVAGAFVYGKNVLKLVVYDDSGGGAESTLTIWLKDFELLAPTTVGFTSNASTSGGLEGAFGAFDHLKATDGSTLNLGAFAIISY